MCASLIGRRMRRRRIIGRAIIVTSENNNRDVSNLKESYQPDHPSNPDQKVMQKHNYKDQQHKLAHPDQVEVYQFSNKKQSYVVPIQHYMQTDDSIIAGIPVDHYQLSNSNNNNN